MTSPAATYLTHCGIPGIGTVPFGIHMCHFYPDRQDLLDALIPYFVAGLRNNERCLWIASNPLPAEDIRREISKKPLLEQGVAAGAVTIMDAAEWYGTSAMLKSEDIIARWKDEERRALANGYKGLRLTGNTSFVPPEAWLSLMQYERELHEGLDGSRIVALCSYSLQACRPVDILDVVHTHHAAFDRFDGDHWQIFSHEKPKPRVSNGEQRVEP